MRRTLFRLLWPVLSTHQRNMGRKLVFGSLFTSFAVVNVFCLENKKFSIKQLYFPIDVELPDLKHGTTFSPKDVTVIFILGGPGAGKGTQCTRLEAETDFVHLSAGDLLRAESSRSGSKYSALIDHYLREGQIVPFQITISLLRDEMLRSGKKKFLIDGFPRNIEQGLEFESAVCECSCVLFFECGEAILVERLMQRGQTSGRTDDNKESIEKRLRTYRENTLPVFDWYNAMGKLYIVQSDQSVDQVFESTKAILSNFL